MVYSSVMIISNFCFMGIRYIFLGKCVFLPRSCTNLKLKINLLASVVEMELRNLVGLAVLCETWTRKLENSRCSVITLKRAFEPYEAIANQTIIHFVLVREYMSKILQMYKTEN